MSLVKPDHRLTIFEFLMLILTLIFFAIAFFFRIIYEFLPDTILGGISVENPTILSLIMITIGFLGIGLSFFLGYFIFFRTAKWNNSSIDSKLGIYRPFFYITVILVTIYLTTFWRHPQIKYLASIPIFLFLGSGIFGYVLIEITGIKDTLRFMPYKATKLKKINSPTLDYLIITFVGLLGLVLQIGFGLEELNELIPQIFTNISIPIVSNILWVLGNVALFSILLIEKTVGFIGLSLDFLKNDILSSLIRILLGMVGSIIITKRIFASLHSLQFVNSDNARSVKARILYKIGDSGKEGRDVSLTILSRYNYFVFISFTNILFQSIIIELIVLDASYNTKNALLLETTKNFIVYMSMFFYGFYKFFHHFWQAHKFRIELPALPSYLIPIFTNIPKRVYNSHFSQQEFPLNNPLDQLLELESGRALFRFRVFDKELIPQITEQTQIPGALIMFRERHYSDIETIETQVEQFSNHLDSINQDLSNILLVSLNLGTSLVDRLKFRSKIGEIRLKYLFNELKGNFATIEEEGEDKYIQEFRVKSLDIGNNELIQEFSIMTLGL